MDKPLDQMSVEELEQESYRLTVARQDIRQRGIMVQEWLSKRLEEQRVSKLLGRDVQIVEASGIDSGEAVGDAGQAE